MDRRVAQPYPVVVAVVVIVAAEFRDRRRLKHEREMQLNEARREAYANLSKLTKGMNIENTEAVRTALTRLSIRSGSSRSITFRNCTSARLTWGEAVP